MADLPHPAGPASDAPRGGEPDGNEPDGKEPDGNEPGAAAAEPPAGEPGPARGSVAAASARAPRTESRTVADLRRRLELLPHGHPSSPYHDDGQRRPPPPRLKHLELAPPAKMVASRNVPAAVVPPGPEPDVSAGATPLPAAAQPAAHGQPPAATAAPPTATAATPIAAAQAIVTAPVGAKPPAAAPTSPDGSWSWGQIRLSRDLIRVADDAYDRFRAAEGRDLFGQYGKGGLTPMLSRVAERTIGGELAPETARNALLEPDEFRARLAELLGRHPDRSPEQLARRVPGALSYSFRFDEAHYAEGIATVQEALELQGFQLRVRRNTWSSAASRYVLTVWHDPLTDLPFHLQFHTQASLEAQRDGGTARR